MNSLRKSETSTILVVDDSPENLILMSSLLRDRYRVKVAPSGARALAIVGSSDPPDLILLDVVMPGIDGHEVCRRLKSEPATADIPVIFLSSRSEVEDEQSGFAAGAVDYIAKPVSPAILHARVETHLLLKRAKDLLADQNLYLEQEVARRTRETAVAQEVAIIALASLAEVRDNETGNHLRRTQQYLRLLSRGLASHPRFARELGVPENEELLVRSAPLHDIGKVGIPDRILHKPGRLTAEEFEVMKTHTTIGRDAILAAQSLLDISASFLRYGLEVVHTHHERWDGTGYPEGLSGEAIPVAGRLMAVADVYDALISRRSYKEAFSHQQAVAILREGHGSHFDPAVLDCFLDISDQFEATSAAYADQPRAID